jgi:sporulation protein YlmC with PRC-barrel domain
MKTNRNTLIAIALTTSLALPLAAQQTSLNANSSDDHDPARTAAAGAVAFNDLQKADKIIGMDVVDIQNRKLGKVKDLAVELQSGRIAEVIVGTGGFVGLDEKMIAVPPGSFAFADSGRQLRLADAETFRTAPFFKMWQWKKDPGAASVMDVYQRFHAASYGNVGALERAGKLIGLTAKNQQLEHLGKVDTLVVDVCAGRVAEVILASGGFLGIKDELSAVPPQAFRFNPDNEMLTLDTTKETLNNAPHFKPDDWRSSVNNSANLAGVYHAYKVPPYFTPGTTTQNVPSREALTAANSGDAQSDSAITVRIRQLIQAADGLSANARSNVQAATQAGRVTLKGTVDSEKEKRQVGDLAATVVPSDHVDNQIEVKEIAGATSLNN